VQVHVSINECVTFSVTVVEDATAVDAQALQVEKDAYIADLAQEVVELRELHGEIRQLHDDASSRCSTATAEASRWQARCGQLQEQLTVAQQAAEESQQQNLAWQQQLWWAARDKLQEINNCWAAKLDAVTRQHQQLEQACEEQQMLLEYYRRGMLADPCLAMQGDGREQLARMVAAEPLLSLHKHFWTLKSSNLLRLWVQHPDLTLAQFEGLYKRMALCVHSDKAHAMPGQVQDEDIKALNNIRALVLRYGQFGGNPA
jgi:hypothetical protein